MQRAPAGRLPPGQPAARSQPLSAGPPRARSLRAATSALQYRTRSRHTRARTLPRAAPATLVPSGSGACGSALGARRPGPPGGAGEGTMAAPGPNWGHRHPRAAIVRPGTPEPPLPAPRHWPLSLTSWGLQTLGGRPREGLSAWLRGCRGSCSRAEGRKTPKAAEFLEQGRGSPSPARSDAAAPHTRPGGERRGRGGPSSRHGVSRGDRAAGATAAQGARCAFAASALAPSAPASPSRPRRSRAPGPERGRRDWGPPCVPPQKTPSPGRVGPRPGSVSPHTPDNAAGRRAAVS